MIFQPLTLTVKKNVIQYWPMSEEKREEDVAPSMNPEERPNLQDYKSKDKGSSSSDSIKTTDFT
jgi:hypothetical protein